MHVWFVYQYAIYHDEAIDFGDINENPNRPTVAVATQLLTEARKALGNSAVNSVKGKLFVQQLTEG